MAHLLIGLGNPELRYAHNRHNIGFMAVDRVAADYAFSKWSLKFGGAVAEGNIGGEKIFAFKPLKYMNLSGLPSAEIASFYKIPLENIIVIHDELDLPLGKLRVKIGGGSGGHNGLKSLDSHLGVDYKRVRLGIDRPVDKDVVSNYVLSDFAKSEMQMVENILTETSRHIALLIKGDDAGFMNKVSLAISG